MYRIPEKHLTDVEMRKVIKQARKAGALVYLDEYLRDLVIANIPTVEAMTIVSKVCGREVRQ